MVSNSHWNCLALGWAALFVAIGTTVMQGFVTGSMLNLVACFTPVASPESNGLAEVFVRTLKRDYARLNPLPDAGTVLGQLGGWFDDYNHHHPHSGLGMRSPREFIAAQQPAKVSG